MPSRTANTTANSATAAPGKRFELPALEFNFSSLTEGTDIPPPPPSPIREEVLTPPKTPAKGDQKTSKVNGSLTSTSPQSNLTTTTVGGTKRPAEDNPASPTFSTRQGSIRRLFSKGLLNTAYAEGEDGGGDSTRPVSRTSASFVDSKKAKRSSGWFSRLRSSDSPGSKRASMVVTTDEKKLAGPPPPMIPELSELKSPLDFKDDSGLGGDLFKDIK